MRIQCPECLSVLSIKTKLEPGQRAALTCRCGQRLRFQAPTPPPAPELMAPFDTPMGLDAFLASLRRFQ